MHYSTNYGSVSKPSELLTEASLIWIWIFCDINILIASHVTFSFISEGLDEQTSVCETSVCYLHRRECRVSFQSILRKKCRKCYFSRNVSPPVCPLRLFIIFLLLCLVQFSVNFHKRWNVSTAFNFFPAAIAGQTIGKYSKWPWKHKDIQIQIFRCLIAKPQEEPRSESLRNHF